jgi:aubergine-like protein
MVANYIPVRCSKDGQYQYAVSFNPEVHSKNMRFKLLYAQSAVIGETRNFDGCILFLPNRLPQEVC